MQLPDAAAGNRSADQNYVFDHKKMSCYVLYQELGRIKTRESLERQFTVLDLLQRKPGSDIYYKINVCQAVNEPRRQGVLIYKIIDATTV